MKKYKFLVISIIFLLLLFIVDWYIDEIFCINNLVTNITLIIMNYTYLILIIYILFKKIIKEKSYIDILSLSLLIIFSFIFWLLPFRETKVKLEFDKYEKQRLEIIEMIKKETLKADKSGNIELPNKYKKCSDSCDVHLYQNDDNGLELGFRVFKGMQSGSLELIYSTGGEELIRENENGHTITKIEKLKDKWYLVTTKY